MKALISLLFLQIFVSTAYSQTDTLSPEKKMRSSIGKIGAKSANLDIPSVFNALNTISNVLVRRTPFLTTKELRSGMADSARVTYVWDASKPGIFVFDPTDVTTSDDTVMTIKCGERRYKRELSQSVMPEIWGAKADGITDNAVPIQRALDYCAKSQKGLKIVFSPGTYYVSKTLKMKPFMEAKPWTYNVTLEGSGVGITNIKAAETFSGNLLEATFGETSWQGKENKINIKDLTLHARGASKCLFIDYFSNVRVTDVRFEGGENVCVQLGKLDGKTLNYSVYLDRCYFLGHKKSGGINDGTLVGYQIQFLEVDKMETDGGKYGIFLEGCTTSTITNSKLEGVKNTVIRILGNGNGEHKINNNYLSAYGGFEDSGVFDGTANGIYISGPNSGQNSIDNNTIRVDASKNWPVVMNYSTISNLHYSAIGDKIVGKKSRAVGYLQAIDQKNQKLLVTPISGSFIKGESFTHTYNGSPGGTGIIGNIKQNRTYGMRFESPQGSNSITGNQFTCDTDYGIYADSPAMNIVSNTIMGKTGIYINKIGTITGNNFWCPGGVAINNDGGLASLLNNTISSGTVIGTPTSNYMVTSLTLKGDIYQNIGSAHYLYNSNNDSINYERGGLWWNGNTFNVGTQYSGEGILKPLNINAGSGTTIGSNNVTKIRLGPTAISGGINIGYSTDAPGSVIGSSPILTGSIGTQYHFSQLSTINQTANAGYTIDFKSIYEQKTGSGPRKLWDWGFNTQKEGTGKHTSWFSGTMNGSTLLILAKNLPICIDNTAAIAAGLPIDTIYRTPTGELKIRY